MDVNYGLFGNSTDLLRNFCEAGHEISFSKAVLVYFTVWIVSLVWTEISRTKVEKFLTEYEYWFGQSKLLHRIYFGLSPLPILWLTKWLFGDACVFLAPLLFLFILRTGLFLRIQRTNLRVCRYNKEKESAKCKFVCTLRSILDKMKGIGYDLSYAVDTEDTYYCGCSGGRYLFRCRGSQEIIWLFLALQDNNDSPQKKYLSSRLSELVNCGDYEKFSERFYEIKDDYKALFERTSGSQGGYATNWHEPPNSDTGSSFWSDYDKIVRREQHFQDTNNKLMDDLSYYAAMDKAREQGIDTSFNSPYSAY